MAKPATEIAEPLPGDDLTTDELLDALDRRNIRYAIALQTEVKNDPKLNMIRVEFTDGMQVFEAYGLAEFTKQHCERWLQRALSACEGSDEESE